MILDWLTWLNFWLFKQHRHAGVCQRGLHVARLLIWLFACLLACLPACLLLKVLPQRSPNAWLPVYMTRLLQIKAEVEQAGQSACQYIIIAIMSQFTSDKARSDQLYKSIFETGIACYFCKFTEDILRCDILYDDSGCKKHLCVHCYKRYQKEQCEAGHSYESHYFNDKKLKFASKILVTEEASRVFQRQQKFRTHPEYSNLDSELVNLMAYLGMNSAQNEQRVSYNTFDFAVRQALSNKKRDQRKLITSTAKTKKASFINRNDHRNTESGIETCGYNRTHQKGISLIFRAFANQEKDGEKPEPKNLQRPSRQEYESELLIFSISEVDHEAR